MCTSATSKSVCIGGPLDGRIVDVSIIHDQQPQHIKEMLLQYDVTEFGDKKSTAPILFFKPYGSAVACSLLIGTLAMDRYGKRQFDKRLAPVVGQPSIVVEKGNGDFPRKLSIQKSYSHPVTPKPTDPEAAPIEIVEYHSKQVMFGPKFLCTVYLPAATTDAEVLRLLFVHYSHMSQKYAATQVIRTPTGIGLCLATNEERLAYFCLRTYGTKVCSKTDAAYIGEPPQWLVVGVHTLLETQANWQPMRLDSLFDDCLASTPMTWTRHRAAFLGLNSPKALLHELSPAGVAAMYHAEEGIKNSVKNFLF